MGEEVCGHFFMNMPDEKMCVNEGFGQQKPKQWCYVSSSCESGEALQWGSAADGVNFRWCGDHEEKLADKSPLELKAWTTKNDLEIGLAVHFAYPAWQPEKLTDDVLSFFGVQPPSDLHPLLFKAEPLTPSLRQRLQEVADAGTATLLVSRVGHPPFGIMRGKELYWLNFSEEQNEHVKNHEDFFAHKGTMNDVKCVAGCGEVAPTWGSPLDIGFTG